MSDNNTLNDIPLTGADDAPLAGMDDAFDFDMDLMERTLRPEEMDMEAMPDAPVFEEKKVFLLKGYEYVEVECLSNTTGEGEVYLVQKDGEQYVLKVYYPSFDVNKKMMQTIRSFHFEMIIPLLDFGKTYVDGKNRTYELQEYMQGGSLSGVKLSGDFNHFRRITLQAAAALEYCHRNGVLHKDIKPGNFFFRDEKKQQLVLGDFGISALIPEDSTSVRTTQARTPVFAAPEMYANVIDGEVDLTPAADFYSLGLTLLIAWLGENPLSSNERTMMRQKSEGRLPRLNDLPDQVKTLIMGLTTVNPQNRWGYDEVEAWFQGEEVKVDTTSPFIHYKPFVVDPERSIVAENVRELVPLLVANENLALHYFYNGQIVSWLEECGNTKLAVIVKDIVNKVYHDNQHAGMMAACYAMEPTLPYRDVKGNTCEDLHAVAIALMSNQAKYAITLRNPDDDLFLWLESHTKCDVNRLRSHFTDQDDGRLAVLKTVYEIDPAVPLFAKHPSSNVKEIVHSAGSQQLTDDEWRALCDGRLLSWLYSHEDMVTCENLRLLLQGQSYSKSLAIKALYCIDATAPYDLRSANTPKGVGQHLSHELMQSEHLSLEDFSDRMNDFTAPDGRFAYYCQTRGWVDLQVKARRCFNLLSEENRERLGSYDLRTALYRFCRILGATPSYLLGNGKIISSPKEIDSLNTAQLRQELNGGSLAQWLAVFFHENPENDFAEEYSYERALETYVLALGRIDQNQTYYKRYIKAAEETTKRVEQVRRDWESAINREKMWKYGFYSVCGIWAIMVFVFGLKDRQVLFDNPFTTMILPLGLMSGIIVSVRSYFKGFGVFMAVLFGLLGFATAYVPYFVLKWVDGTLPILFHPMVVVFTAIYILIAHFTDFSREQKTDSGFINEMLNTDDVKTSLLEPLYYTFKQRSARYNASRFSALDEVTDMVNSLSGESVVHYVLWTLTAVVMIFELCLLSPKLVGWNPGGKAKQEQVSTVAPASVDDVNQQGEGE